MCFVVNQHILPSFFNTALLLAACCKLYSYFGLHTFVTIFLIVGAFESLALIGAPVSVIGLIFMLLCNVRCGSGITRYGKICTICFFMPCLPLFVVTATVCSKDGAIDVQNCPLYFGICALGIGIISFSWCVYCEKVRSDGNAPELKPSQTTFAVVDPIQPQITPYGTQLSPQDIQSSRQEPSQQVLQVISIQAPPGEQSVQPKQEAANTGEFGDQ